MGTEDEKTERYFTRGRLSRGRGLRNTTGCATCRRRHVKCDEKKPVCGGCERTKRTCAYVQRRPLNRERSGPVSVSSRNEDVSRQSVERGSGLSQSRSPSPSPLGCPPVINDVTGQISSPPTTGGEPEQPLPATATPASGNPPREVPGDDNIHASYNDAVASAPTLQPQVAVQSAEDPPCTGATPHDPALTSSSLGANLENATAIWVDLLLQDASMQQLDFSSLNFQADAVDLFGSSVVAHSPAVGRSSQNNTGDGLSPTLCTSHPYLHERAPNLDEYQRLEKQAWKSASSLPILPQEHKVFQNFVLHVSQWMDLFEPSRPFGTLVPQLAMRNIGLMNAILALSARHLSLGTTPDGKDAQGPNDALRYYYKTLHYIQEAMQYDTYKTSLELLATSSIVSAYEMLDGSRQDWERHLKGVFCIQRSQGIHGDSFGLKQAVWWAWLCQDVWAAFRERRRPFTFWRPLRTLDELDPYELAARSVYFFAQIVAFCSREETERGREDPLARVAAAEALRDTLEDWRRHLTAEFQPLPFAGLPEDVFEPIWINPPAFAVAFQVYYCSHILLLLHVPALGGLDEYTKQRKRLMECVRRVCGIGMTSTDYPSSFMSSQCLFIAGLPLEDSRERNFVLELLEAHRLRSGWPIKPLGEELKARWEASDV
ncbi:Putative zn(2)Cys(6) fungal-type DNA-binding domain, fungal transcription factor [Colletotrichum destructivum]|uniref:Zn(2)Cys(6) fungal-type DNA-binding domain, fungal transcription factor n=1 Tax=Colletotrichum destructivum TaxID=34406 RepID=A0AAX4IWX4_9PEZI|nr:Putative zn(2)Cys(6) fungal-type DNA-binding domain, fungal transcription factor [Colletotrichum destructivum]